MGFKAVGAENFKYVSYKECEEGQVLAEGTYLGHRLDRYQKPAHMIKESDGSIQVLNSSGSLNYKLENFVTPGDFIRVTYDGEIKLTKGPMKGKMSHQFLVEIDEELRKDGIKTPTNAAPEEDDDSDLAEELDEEEVEEITKYKRAPATSKKTRKVVEEDEELDEAEEETEAPVRKRASNDDILARYRRKRA